MAHELESQNGKVAFASYREPAWHKLGTVFTEPVKSSKTMLKKAHLAGWNVRLIDVADTLGDYEVDGRPLVFNRRPLLVVRDNPFGENTVDVLGAVGERYRELQNEEAFALLDDIVENQGTWETAGAIKGGTVVFGSMTIDREVVLDPKGVADKTKMYLMVHTSHNGTKALGAMLTPVRVVCANTLNLALRGAKQSFNLRHTQSLHGRVEEARRVLGIVFNYSDVFETHAKTLFQTKITEDDFHKLFLAAHPLKSDGKGPTTRHDNLREAVVEIYHSPTCEGIRGTAWGAMNALTERIDWHRTPRNGDPEANLRAASGFDPVINTKKNEIFTLAWDMFVGNEANKVKVPRKPAKSTEKAADTAAQIKAVLDKPKGRKTAPKPVSAAPRRGRPVGSKNAGKSSLFS